MIELLGARGTVRAETLSEPSAEHLWIRPAAVADATGWSVQPQGLCSGSLCTPLAPDLREACVGADRVDAAALWRALDRPVLASKAHDVFVLGESAGDRAARMQALEAPDFALPDLEGNIHRLSDHRGKKVLLVTWASW